MNDLVILHEMKRSDIESILRFMGDGYDIFAKGYTRSVSAGDFETCLSVETPPQIDPLFWIAVSTWYCEREHRDVFDVPSWTPFDLAQDAYRVPGVGPIIFFPSFRLVEDL